MSTTAPPVERTEADVISVVLNREHAHYVAKQFQSDLGSEFEEHTNYPTREDIDTIKATIDTFSAKLEQITWGEPERDVTLTLPRGELEELGMALVNIGADGLLTGDTPEGMTYVQGRRLFAHEFEAGMTILEQLEATR